MEKNEGIFHRLTDLRIVKKKKTNIWKYNYFLKSNLGLNGTVIE